MYRALNKRIGDQLREIQQTEAQQAKERFDLDIKCFDQIEALKAEHISRKAELETSQSQELIAEKERLAAKHERDKISLLEIQHSAEIKKLNKQHREQIRALKSQQEISLQQRYRNVDSALVASTIKITGASPSRSRQPGANSASISRAESNESMDRSESVAGGSVAGASVTANSHFLSNIKLAFQSTQEDEDEVADGNGSNQSIADKGKLALRSLQKKHTEALSCLVLALKEEMEDCQLSTQARLRELDDSHDLQVQSLRSEHEMELENIISIQEKEIAMEASVHEAELRMLIERRILNSVLDTVVDGIINIDPIGTIKRFNPAAEKMFGYKSSEVIDTNIRDLMPKSYSVEHDSYLNNYLTTGVKKVIGGSRRAFGLRKDRSTFPILLSVSEVKEDGAHLFTGIVRDLTEEVKITF